MEIRQTARAGTNEKSDILIEIFSADKGVHLELYSTVEKCFGTAVRKTIKEVIKEFGIQNVYVKATDKGALDYTIKARTETALKRACKGGSI